MNAPDAETGDAAPMPPDDAPAIRRASARAGKTLSRPLQAGASPHLDAFDTVENTRLVENTLQNSSVLAARPVGYTPFVPPSEVENTAREEGGSGPHLRRDAAALFAIVRLRIVSISQIAPLVFPGASIVVARRRLRRLRERGWLATWDRPSRSGAATRYLYPTKKALRWAYRHALQTAQGTPAATVVRLMLPTSTRRLLTLTPREEPLWLPHQDEVNKLVISRALALGDRALWWSTWDCPFPDRLNGLKAPQPDYVVVAMEDGVPRLIFGEHDRNTEDRRRWMEKIAAYAAAREMCQTLFGVATFTVDVTVSDPVTRRPIHRVQFLTRLARESAAATYMRFALAGWTHAYPWDAVRFIGGAIPESRSTGGSRMEEEGLGNQALTS
jgi:hypothetical protein